MKDNKCYYVCDANRTLLVLYSFLKMFREETIFSFTTGMEKFKKKPQEHKRTQVLQGSKALFQSPVMKRTSFLGVSSKSSRRSSQTRLTSASLALLAWGIDLDYCDIE